MGVLTRTTDVPAVVNEWFSKELLLRVVPRLVHGLVATRRPLKANSGTTIKFRRVEELPIPLEPLVEGVPPSGKKITTSEVEATVRQHGDYVSITDLEQATIDHPILTNAQDVLSEQAQRLLESLKRDEFVAGTSVIYPTGVASRATIGDDNAHRISENQLQRAIRLLNQNDALRFTRMINAVDAQQTFPIRPAFWAITTPEVLFDLENLENFIPVEKYASTSPVQEAEVGAYRDIRFLVTNLAKSYPDAGAAVAGTDNASTTGTVADVHTILVFAREAVAEIPLDGLNFETIINPRTSGGVANPLHQYGTAAWKRTGAEVILNDNFLTRLEVAVTA